MLKASIGALGGAIFVILCIATWLVWPAPSVDLNWEDMTEELISQEDCFGAALVLGSFGFVDPTGFHEVVDSSLQVSVCAVPEDSELPADRYFLENLYPLSPEIIALLEPTSWWQGVKAAAKRWDDVRWYRQEVGMGFAGWIDAVAFFRCERTLGHYPAGHWLSARDDLHSQFPDFVAPYDARRARCIAFVAAELERVTNTDVGPEYRESVEYQQILNDYGFLLHTLRGSMEFIQN